MSGHVGSPTRVAATAPWLLTLLLAAAAAAPALAQRERAAGVAAETSTSFDLPRAWDVVAGLGIEARPYFDGGEGADAPPTLRNLDINLALRRRWLERWRFGNAVRVRSRYPGSAEAARELRLWLYAERITDAGYVRWASRFRTEQRLRGAVGRPLTPSYRHRYRIAAERALAGEDVDPGEWYFTAGVELLLSTERPLGGATAVDVRPSAAVGRGDLEFGLEYRRERALARGERPGGAVEEALLGVLVWSW